MTAKSFLNQLITTTPNYSLSESDQRTIQREGINKYIFAKLNSSKYRAQATSEDYQQKVQAKIKLAVDNNSPVHLTLPFGATKNPYLPTAPGIDWAEVFNLAYLRDYLAPVAAGYHPGVILEYISVAVFEEPVNLIPQVDVDLYDQQFTTLIDYFQNYLPVNFTLKYTGVSDLIPPSKILTKLQEKVDELRRSWNDLPLEVRERKLLRARRNCLCDPQTPNYEDLVLTSALGHDAFCSEYWTTKAAPWDEPHMITLGHNYTQGWAIHVRSTRGSSVNFWSGVGALITKPTFIPTVLSPQQLISSQTTLEPVDLLSNISTNLRQIYVVN